MSACARMVNIAGSRGVGSNDNRIAEKKLERDDGVSLGNPSIHHAVARKTGFPPHPQPSLV